MCSGYRRSPRVSTCSAAAQHPVMCSPSVCRCLPWTAAQADNTTLNQPAPVTEQLLSGLWAAPHSEPSRLHSGMICYFISNFTWIWSYDVKEGKYGSTRVQDTCNSEVTGGQRCDQPITVIVIEGGSLGTVLYHETFWGIHESCSHTLNSGKWLLFFSSFCCQKCSFSYHQVVHVYHYKKYWHEKKKSFLYTPDSNWCAPLSIYSAQDFLSGVPFFFFFFVSLGAPYDSSFYSLKTNIIKKKLSAQVVKITPKKNSVIFNDIAVKKYVFRVPLK